MPTNLINFYSDNLLDGQNVSYTSQLRREYRSVNAVLSPDYVLNLQEQNLFRGNEGKILELFLIFRTLSIYQAAQFMLPQYTVDGHKYLADFFARLYHLYFIHPVDIEDKLNKNKSVFPLPSLTFILGPAGARYLAAKHNKTPVELGWNKSNMITSASYGMHNVIVSEIVIRLMYITRLLQMTKNVSVSLDIASEWEGRLLPKAGGNKVIARPDYTMQVTFTSETTATPVVNTYFLEYDNGTENMDILAQKIGDYNMAYAGGRFVLGNPSNTALAFVFNKPNRASQFLKALYITKRESSSIPYIYITTLDNIYQLGYFNDQWIKVDVDKMREHQRGKAEKKDVSEIQWHSKASPFPELHNHLVASNIYPIIQSYYEQQVDMGNQSLKMEFDVFSNFRLEK